MRKNLGVMLKTAGQAGQHHFSIVARASRSTQKTAGQPTGRRDKSGTRAGQDLAMNFIKSGTRAGQDLKLIISPLCLTVPLVPPENIRALGNGENDVQR